MLEIPMEELELRAEQYRNFPNMSAEERQQILDDTEKWIETFSDEEKEEILEALRLAAGVSKAVANGFDVLQQVTSEAMTGMDGAEPIDLFGFDEDTMVMYARWLDMEAFRFHELEEMSVHEAWVTGMLIGLRIGILLEQQRDG